MCTIITGVLPASVRLAEVQALGKPMGFAFEPVENTHIRAQLRAGEIYLKVTELDCDCGTVLGSCIRPVELDASQYDREVKKLRKKGWRAAKIFQRLSNQREALRQKTLSENIEAESMAPQAEIWAANLTRLLDSGSTPQLGLLLHWYTGNLGERIHIKERKRVTLQNLDPRILLELEENVLYDFTK